MSRADLRRLLAVTAGLITVLLAALLVGPPPASAATLDWYRVSNLGTGKCMDNYARTNNIYQYPCGAGVNQLFTWYQVPGRPGDWYIENMAYYGCMEPNGGGGIILRECYSGRTTSMWRWVPVSGGWYKIVNVASGRCVEVPNSSSADVQLVTAFCNSQNKQLWKGELRYTG